jgi:hypothetical protein
MFPVPERPLVRSFVLRSLAYAQMSPLPDFDELAVDAVAELDAVDALADALDAVVPSDTALLKDPPPPHAPSATIITAAVSPTRALFMAPPRLPVLVVHPG